MRRSASLAALLILSVALSGASAQSVKPVVTLTMDPPAQEVDASQGAGRAVFNCTVAVEGLPLVRYHVNLTAEAGGWECACEPRTFTFTGSANESFTAAVTVPAGEAGGQDRQVNLTANVTAGGLPVANGTATAIVTVGQNYSLKLSSDTSSLSVEAGKVASWGINLRNTGNGRDSFQFSVVNLLSFTSAGWVVRFNPVSVSVNPGSTARVLLNLTPPAGLPNQTVTVQASAYSRGAKYNNFTVEDRLELSLNVRAVPPVDGDDKVPPTPKGAPGPGPLGLAIALALTVLLGIRKRK